MTALAADNPTTVIRDRGRKRKAKGGHRRVYSSGSLASDFRTFQTVVWESATASHPRFYERLGDLPGRLPRRSPPGL